MISFMTKSLMALTLITLSGLVAAQATISGPRDYSLASDGSLGTLAEGTGIEAGQPAPDAQLLSVDNEEIALSDLWEDQDVLLIFYRGGWCPFCNAQIRDLTVQYEGFEERGLLPVLVSVDKPDVAAVASATYEVPFPIMSDSDLDAHKAYNVVLEISDEQYEATLARGRDLEDYSGEDHHVYAMASSFLIEQGGQLVWSHLDLDYRTRPSPEQYLQVADDLL
jgi:peroxiredoxin